MFVDNSRIIGGAEIANALKQRTYLRKQPVSLKTDDEKLEEYQLSEIGQFKKQGDKLVFDDNDDAPDDLSKTLSAQMNKLNKQRKNKQETNHGKNPRQKASNISSDEDEREDNIETGHTNQEDLNTGGEEDGDDMMKMLLSKNLEETEE